MRCVTDANIWIDLHHADLLDAAFAMEIRWITPDIVLREELIGPNRELRILLELGLIERTLSGEELNRIAALNGIYPRPSPKDLSVLVVTDKEDGIVITGDGPLREAAEAEGLEVHGVLWVLDELIDREHITPSRAAAGLEVMLQEGSHLPEGPVEKRLHRWRE